MTLSLFFYRVSISAVAQSSPGDGFVDNKDTQLYGTLATDLAHAKTKTRAFLRWQAIIQQVGSLVSPVEVVSIVATGADINTAATTFAFTLAYDRIAPLVTADETSPGTIISTPTAVIKRLVARALTSIINRTVAVVDPTLVANTPSSSNYGPSIISLVAGAAAASISDAETAITVTAISNT